MLGRPFSRIWTSRVDVSPSWDESGIFLAQRDGVKSSAMIAPNRPGSSNINSCGCECEAVPEKGCP